MNFNSSDFGYEAPPPLVAPQKPRPQRSRAILGTILAAVIAFILIAIVLAIISALGERRLALLQSGAIAPVTVRHSTRATPGLLAPPPLPTHHPLPPTIDFQNAGEPGRALVVAPAAGPMPAAPQAALVPPPVQIPPPPPTAWGVRQILGTLPFTRIHDAFLWKPYAEPNPKVLQRPLPAENLMQLRQASRLSPQAVRIIVEERRPLETLAQMRAQASMNRAATATTRPSS